MRPQDKIEKFIKIKNRIIKKETGMIYASKKEIDILIEDMTDEQAEYFIKRASWGESRHLLTNSCPWCLVYRGDCYKCTYDGRYGCCNDSYSRFEKIAAKFGGKRKFREVLKAHRKPLVASLADTDIEHVYKNLKQGGIKNLAIAKIMQEKAEKRFCLPVDERPIFLRKVKINNFTDLGMAIQMAKFTIVGKKYISASVRDKLALMGFRYMELGGRHGNAVYTSAAYIRSGQVRVRIVKNKVYLAVGLANQHGKYRAMVRRIA